MRNFRPFSVLTLIFLIVACGSENTPLTTESVEKNAVINLICGSGSQTNCLSRLCENADKCPILSALSNKAIFDFVETYSDCQDCNTPEFSPERGIGKCIEYLVSEISTGWTITFWVSENCSFRYGSPSDSHINVNVNSETLKIESIAPPVEYLTDPMYCRTNADCFCLSGSGVPFVGCTNYFYAPLNWSGYYPGNNCVCKANQCVGK